MSSKPQYYPSIHPLSTAYPKLGQRAANINNNYQINIERRFKTPENRKYSSKIPESCTQEKYKNWGLLHHLLIFLFFFFFTANEYRSHIFGVSPVVLGGRRCWSLCTCSLSWPGCSHCWSAPRGSWASLFEGRDRSRRRMQRRWLCVSGGIEAGCHWRHRPHIAEWREP